MTETDHDRDLLERLQREAWNLVLHTTSGEATHADVASLKRWCAQSPRHAEAFARASERWRSLGPAMENIARKEAGLVGQFAKPERLMGRRALLGGALAASAAAAAIVVVRPPLGLWPSTNEFAADYRTATGQQRRIALAEHLSLEMNTRTSLNIHAAGSEAESIELVSGEATIAAQSKPVEVVAGGGRMSADTAQFNVRCEGREATVTCVSGQVRVKHGDQSMLLEPRQQVAYSDDGLGAQRPVDPDIVTGWRQGDLRFENEPLSRVIDEINRYRSGRIVLMNDALGQRRYTARFKLDRLDIVIAQLKATFGARVTTLPGGLVIVS